MEPMRGSGTAGRLYLRPKTLPEVRACGDCERPTPRRGCPNPSTHFPRGVWAAVLRDLSRRKRIPIDTLKKRIRRAAMAARGEPLR